MRKILLILLISIIILTGCTKETKKEKKKIVENNGMLSYTIDGEKTDIKPTKEDGYIVNKIICDNGSDMMWDNDNWEVELTKINSKDRCKVDFTKDLSAPGYRITVTSNKVSELDSLSKATTENGTVKIYSKSKIESVTGCFGFIEDNKVIVNSVNSNQTCNITIEDKTLAGIIKAAYLPKQGRTNFGEIDDGEPALYTDTDGHGATYYFSGDGTNMKNWVSFAGKLWRIIRINGNGSVRLLYAGTGGEDGYLTKDDIDSTVANNEGMRDDGKVVYNKEKDHPAYVGWKYTNSGTPGSLEKDRANTEKSSIYRVVESWYIKNIVNSGLETYIDNDAIYCNDRNIGLYSYSTSSRFYYAGYNRLTDSSIKPANPTFYCNNESDSFKDGFGLMTADEISYAGGFLNTRNPKAYYYLNSSGECSTGGNWWWTMTPYEFSWNNIDSVYASMFVGGNKGTPGILTSQSVNTDADILNPVVRPVISLNKNVLVSEGNGSADSPYEVSL